MEKIGIVKVAQTFEKKFVKNDEPKKRKKKVEKGNNYKKRCDGDHTSITLLCFLAVFGIIWKKREKKNRHKKMALLSHF